METKHGDAFVKMEPHMLHNTVHNLPIASLPNMSDAHKVSACSCSSHIVQLRWNGRGVVYLDIPACR
jgi:hypothetical protein